MMTDEEYRHFQRFGFVIPPVKIRSAADDRRSLVGLLAMLEHDRGGARAGKRRGRPLGKDAGSSLEAIKPWVEEGMSRATWFRRQKAKQE